LKSKGRGPQTQTDALANGAGDQSAAGRAGGAGIQDRLVDLPRVAALIENLTGVRYHPGHVWRLLGASGFSAKGRSAARQFP